jgi:hypothetical protein
MRHRSTFTFKVFAVLSILHRYDYRVIVVYASSVKDTTCWDVIAIGFPFHWAGSVALISRHGRYVGGTINQLPTVRYVAKRHRPPDDVIGNAV